MKRIVLAVSINLIFLVLCTNEVLACKCVPFTPKQHYSRAKLIVIGKVVSQRIIGEQTGAVEVVFAVEDAWKINIPSTITIYTNTTTCGSSFDNQEQYLLFLKESSDKWVTNKCAGSKKLSDAQKEIRWLKRYAKQKHIKVLFSN